MITGMSPIVAGCARMAGWGWSAQQRLAWIEELLALGITSFDHADVYGDYGVETLFGEALALAPALRRRIQLVSKCGVRLVTPAGLGNVIKHYDTSAAHIRASVERSLRMLRTEQLDVLLIHCADALLDADEVARVLDALRAEGKVVHYGAAGFPAPRFALLHRRCPLVTNQVELSPLALGALSDGTLDQCQDLGLRPMVRAPLAGGRLLAGDDDAARRVRDCLDALGRETFGVPPVTLACAWVLRHPSRPRPVIGSRRLDVARDAVAALQVTLDAQQWYRLWRAGAGREVE